MALFKKRTKEDVKSKTSILKGVKKNGKDKKFGTVVAFKDGTSVTLLNPSGKGAKYAGELKTNIAVTNDCVIKRDDYGYPVELTAEQRAYRAGYLDHAKDCAKAYNAKKNKAGKK